MAYDTTKYQQLRSLNVPYKLALALSDEDSPLALVAANVAEIADPGTATTTAVANKVNELIGALVDAGLMEA
jgi:hypothetical protein